VSRALGLTPHLFVKDVDTSLSFYGKVLETEDPGGHRWALTTKRERFTPEDIDARTPREV